MRYHKKISEAKTFRGLNRDGIIAASLYVSSRVNHNPRTPKEIATIFHLDNTSATKGCKNAINIINSMEHNLSNEEKTTLIARRNLVNCKKSVNISPILKVVDGKLLE